MLLWAAFCLGLVQVCLRDCLDQGFAAGDDCLEHIEDAFSRRVSELAWVVWRLAAYLVVLVVTTVLADVSETALAAGEAILILELATADTEDTEDRVVTVDPVGIADMEAEEAARRAGDAVLATRADAAPDAGDKLLKN